MTRYIVRRLLYLIPTMIGLSIISFAVMRLTGDPAVMVLGDSATREVLEAYRVEHGLDAPLHIQYLRYMGGVLVGDFGESLRYRLPVGKLLMMRLPATLELGGSALALSLVVGIPIGVLSAVRRSGFVDYFLRGIVLLAQAVPGFYLGILLILVFAVKLGWLPTGGRDGLRNLVLPTIALGTYLVALIVRFTRSAMLDVLHEDYVRTAQAKGLRPRRVIFGHAFKNAMIPLVTVIGLQTAVLMGGAVVTETVFAWPGLGRFTVDAIYARDFPVVQTVVLFIAVLVVLINLVVDIVYGFVDPRVRHE